MKDNLSVGNESDAIDLAKMYVSKFFNEDTNRFSVSATFNDDEKSVHPKGWFVRLYPLEYGVDKWHRLCSLDNARRKQSGSGKGWFMGRFRDYKRNK